MPTSGSGPSSWVGVALLICKRRDILRLMRADALRNRERLLEATIELILESGGEPTRDAVAARAGVGIGTL